MSALPARPRSPDSCSSASASSRSVIPVCSSSHSSSPGSTLPDRVAITSPSSGVKPIVVSTQRPSRTAASDAPAPRWQVTTRPGARASRRPGVGEAVEAVAPQRPALAPGGGQRVGRRGSRQPGVERGVEARDRGQPRPRLPHRSERGERLRLVQRRQRRQLLESGGDLVVDHRRSAEALSAVHDPMADRIGLPELVERAADVRRRARDPACRAARRPPRATGA